MIREISFSLREVVVFIGGQNGLPKLLLQVRLHAKFAKAAEESICSGASV
jgi:hypothetical protein